MELDAVNVRGNVCIHNKILDLKYIYIMSLSTVILPLTKFIWK